MHQETAISSPRLLKKNDSYAFLIEPRRLFFTDGQPEAALASLLPHLEQQAMGSSCEKRAATDLAGIVLKKLRRYQEASALYGQINDFYQAGYCQMLAGDLSQAVEYWKQLADIRPNHWCISLFGLVSGKFQAFPTTFQIRAYLEGDVYQLIYAHQLEFLENLLGQADKLSSFNLESHKFIGRTLYYAGWVKRASSFLLKGQQALPNDPEVYFHLAQCRVQLGDTENARLMLKQCLMISPLFGPAKELLTAVGDA